MNLFSDMLTVAGACAGILLVVVLFLTPAIADLADRAGRRRLPGDAVGSLPATADTDDAEILALVEAVREPAPVALPAPRGTVLQIPAQSPQRQAVRELALPLQRRATAPVIPFQRSLSTVSRDS
ncbi:hypothetical protein GCM10009836_51270 [Pseudonocardia ailaonensis]|uniref:Uncharacterized protein n=1 Tax=Pseudonocardia ailaonensis TaxID=367279 RepID=A0ABN2NDQ8_9PSEU